MMSRDELFLRIVEFFSDCETKFRLLDALKEGRFLEELKKYDTPEKLEFYYLNKKLIESFS